MVTMVTVLLGTVTIGILLMLNDLTPNGDRFEKYLLSCDSRDNKYFSIYGHHRPRPRPPGGDEPPRPLATKVGGSI
jgi:hypothetical protein